MKIACSKFDCFTDYNKCKDCQYKVESTDTYVSCYHALDADDLKFNVAVFKDGYNPQKDIAPPQKEQVTKPIKLFDFKVYDRVILTEI